MSTLPSRIREACGVERFDVADTAKTLEENVRLLRKKGFTRELAILIVASSYKCAIRELTTKTT